MPTGARKPRRPITSDNWLDVSAMSPEELVNLNRTLSRKVSSRARSLREYKGAHGRKIGQKSVGYRQALERGWVKPRTKAEGKQARKSPKKTAFGKRDRIEQIKEVREKIRWLKDPLNIRSGIKHAISVLGTADPESMPYRLYNMMNDLYPSISYVISRKPRKRYNSDYWIEVMFEIVDSTLSVDEMVNRMKEVAENAYEEQNHEDEDDDSFLFGGRQK